ncbi:hypothetical protein MKX01_026885 [Papaver californicum]|nr:hypothetical protein MKX01_026885 [Papaver californicum]
MCSSLGRGGTRGQPNMTTLFLLKTGIVNSVFVGTALLDMYTKCGCIALGCRVFEEMPERNVVSWTAILSALGHAGYNKESLRYFVEMCKSYVECDSYTFASAAKACADSNALNYGREIHRQAIKVGVDSTSFVSNTLAAMYNKCGKLEYGLCLFERMRTRDVVSWTTTIATYLQLGREEKTAHTFLQMRDSDISPNGFTFAAVICCCAGLAKIEWGEQLHAHSPSMGFIDSLSVANATMKMLNEAEEMILSMPFKQDDVVWLLRTCMVHTDAESAKRIQKEAANVRKTMKSKGVLKEPAWSMVWVNKDQFSTFVAGDRSHSQGKEIYSMLDLVRRLEEMTDNSTTLAEIGS